MTEHVHEWDSVYGGGVECRHCDAELNLREIEARLNATEMLKDKAKLWRHHEDCEPLSQEGCICGLWDARSGYADTLEGK